VSDANSPAQELLQQLTTLPFLSADIAAVTGRIKSTPEDFVVEEVPAYLPSGEGEHLYLWVEKRGLNTVDAARALATALDTPFAEVGWAGLKDRHAITRQWLSFHCTKTPRPEDLALEGVRVLSSARHGNKLRTGHLRGNRFSLRLTDVPEGHEVQAQACLERLQQRGLPNYYGSQRFGHGGRNLVSGYGMVVKGERPPPKPFLRKLFMSALQSALFNVWLATRIERELFDRVLEGDVLRKEDTGGLFLCSDPQADHERSERWEISITGPMFGSRMKSPDATALTLEAELLERWGVDAACLKRAEKYGEGTRRAARVRPEAVHCERIQDDLLLSFELPKGAYATVLVEELTKTRGLGLSLDS
jgi:tRNA pseudouridine13 synthase